MAMEAWWWNVIMLLSITSSSNIKQSCLRQETFFHTEQFYLMQRNLIWQQETLLIFGAIWGHHILSVKVISIHVDDYTSEL